MGFRWLLLLFLSAHFTTPILAQWQFTVPDGNKRDYSTTFTLGSTIPIAWDAGWKGLGNPIEIVDLWITWGLSDAFAQLLKANITLTDADSFSWKINVNASTVTKDNRFVFRFLKHFDPPYYTGSPNESPSRLFYLAQASKPSSTTSLATTTPSSTETSTSTSSSSPTPLPSQLAASQSSMSSGAIIGISVGLAVFCSVLTGTIVWIYLRRRRASQPVNQFLPPPQYYYQVPKDGFGHPAELCVQNAITLELSVHNTPTPELSGREIPLELGNARR